MTGSGRGETSTMLASAAAATIAGLFSSSLPRYFYQ